MEPVFKIGDRVRLVDPSPRTKRKYSLLVGEEGTVVDIGYGCDVLMKSYQLNAYYGGGGVDWAYELLYGIEWRNLVTNGENCRGNGKEGHGSYVEDYEIERI
ncbi:MAG: hypothetical protein M1438_02225 [Deltaproteobacteria bacterium]|nr:hypothetical protein [Deltaproteobacteria bacterium]